MNFSVISQQSFLGKALRFPLKFIPRNLCIPILQGKLRGKRWIVGSSTHGCWIGSYEYEKRRIFEKLVTPGSVVFDIGAHVGFYTLLASELVGSSGKVFAFEPVPRNLRYLRAHLEINNVKNVTVISAAVSDHSGATLFAEESSHSAAHIYLQGSFQVEMVCLDDLFTQGEIPMPDFIKMDIEGGELRALVGATLLLTNGSPTIFLATHGREIHRKCCELLCSLGYSLEPIAGESVDDTDELLAQKGE